MSKGRVVVILAYNESGKRIGESHHNSRISDEMVDHIRELHEDFGRTRRQIADELQIAYSTVEKIVYYQRRAQTPQKWKRTYVDAEKLRKLQNG